jgi:hypothetical protein
MSTPDTPRYGTVDRDYGRRLATTPPDEDGPIWMVNLMKYRAVADYGDSSAAAISGREADDLYAPLEVLTDIGAEVVFVADVDQQLLGDDPVWDRVGVVKYPSRRAFIDMQRRPDFLARHVHKDAGMERTIVMGCRPMPSPTADPATVPDWADVAHPPTDDDPPVVVLHVLRYDAAAAADVSPEEMEAYTAAAALVAVPHGVRIDGWFAVEGTIVGDGRAWDQVRLNAFPSKAAFMAVVMDPARLEAQRRHRERAIADTYTMILRPTINLLADPPRSQRASPR